MVFSFQFQQIRASDIWTESQHEDLQHRLLDYHLKITMKGTEFDPPTIKFEGSTYDSKLDIQLRIDVYGKKEFVQIRIRRQASCTTVLFYCHIKLGKKSVGVHSLSTMLLGQYLKISYSYEFLSGQ